jgi:hypothetical protein
VSRANHRPAAHQHQDSKHRAALHTNTTKGLQLTSLSAPGTGGQHALRPACPTRCSGHSGQASPLNKTNNNTSAVSGREPRQPLASGSQTPGQQLTGLSPPGIHGQHAYGPNVRPVAVATVGKSSPLNRTDNSTSAVSGREPCYPLASEPQAIGQHAPCSAPYHLHRAYVLCRDSTRRAAFTPSDNRSKA